jgi:hypothetical protein
MTRFHCGRAVAGQAPAQSQNEADRSRATKTGQITHRSISKTTFLLYPAAIGDIAAA